MGDPSVEQSGSVQPAEAQPENGGDPTAGSQGGFGDLYDLSAAPEELRPYLEQEVKKVASAANRKFEEHANYRKQWEPFEQVEGLRDIDPADLSELVQFHEIASDPEAFFNWWGSIPSQLVDPNDQEGVERLERAWGQIGEQLGFFDGPDGGEGGEGDLGGFEGGESGEPPEWAQSLMTDIEQLKQGTVQSQQQQQLTEARQWIRGELDRLQQEHGEQFDEQTEEIICRLAGAYDPGDEKAIEKAYGDLQRIKGNGQSELVDEASSRPGASPSGGAPDTAPEKFSGLDDPALKQAARARFAGKV